MTTLEKLAIEHGAVHYSPPPMRAVKGISFTFEQLEAFAKAYAQQSSEPVGDFYFANDEWHYVPEKAKAHVSKIFTLVKLFTHPPASVPLEKYNKVVDALKELVSENKRNRINAPNNTLFEITANMKAEKLIEESEGKEG